MKAKIIVASLAVLLIAAGAAAFSIVQTVKGPPRLFRRNAELKAQGYYMAEFEFKMEAALYHLNEGAYWSSYRTLKRISDEMETLEGLPRIPPNASPEQLIAFMLERQNPDTGAFMDSWYPFFTYIGPTANVLEYLDVLSRKTGRPVKLKYRLRFLDEIADTERLRSYLNSLLYFKEAWAEKFGGPTPYCPGVSELSPSSIELFERVGGYRFSDEWKHALRDWFYQAQDPATGFWGARIGDERRWRQALDIDSTSHILKHFLTERGEPLDARYPLRYSDALARTLLKAADTPVPEDAVEQHEWIIRQSHAAKILVRWLWPTLSDPLRTQSRKAMSRWLVERFKMYRPEQGGFAIDASSTRADIDATASSISFLRHVGAIPGTWERERLGAPSLLAGSVEAGPVVLNSGKDAAALFSMPPANSIRVYRDSVPQVEKWDDSNLLEICYPTKTAVLDIMDVRRRLFRFLAADGGEYGNWSSKSALRDAPLGLDREIREVPAAQGWPDLARIAREHPKSTRFFVVGFDAMQCPVYEVEIRRSAP